MFGRGRFSAAFAVAVGIGFPALAGAAGGAHTRQASAPPQGAGQSHDHAVLERPARRLQRSIEVHVSRIRARERRRQRQAFAELPAGVSAATLEAIAACESGGDPTAVSSDGSYRGKYQFGAGTWASVGGSGDPAAAPEPEQDYRAALLYMQAGSSPWPICG